MGFQSAINSLVGAVVGTAALKGVKGDKAKVKSPQAAKEQPEATKQVAATQKGVDQDKMVASTETKLATNPGFAKTAANSMGMMNRPFIFSTYSQQAESSSMVNMAQEVQGRYNQMNQFRSRIKASRKKVGGR